MSFGWTPRSPLLTWAVLAVLPLAVTVHAVALELRTQARRVRALLR